VTVGKIELYIIVYILTITRMENPLKKIISSIVSTRHTSVFEILEEIDSLCPSLDNETKKECVKECVSFLRDSIDMDEYSICMKQWDSHGYPIKCYGCVYERPNQLDHVGIGGCLE